VSAPRQKPGKSRQDYETPADFLKAVVERFGPLAWDLAATRANAKAPSYFTPEDDSLKKDWGRLQGTLFLNPPFADISPWAEKCANTRDRKGFTLLLTPASVDSEWFDKHVDDKAVVLFLAPRLSFDGKDPYPKGLMLSVFGFGLSGQRRWRWK
jgi:phage N-6-adenine-methyltransferase